LFLLLHGGPGPRDASQTWHPDNARTLLQYATAKKSPVEIWELGNKITAAAFFPFSPAQRHPERKHLPGWVLLLSSARRQELAASICDEITICQTESRGGSSLRPLRGGICDEITICQTNTSCSLLLAGPYTLDARKK